jgi:hypothetical protein
MVNCVLTAIICYDSDNDETDADCSGDDSNMQHFCFTFRRLELNPWISYSDRSSECFFITSCEFQDIV